jgi:uncharacterized protein YqjF (DUF2071 family)
VTGSAEIAPPFIERRRPFMTARWSNPIVLTFHAPRELLRRVVHDRLELDEWDHHPHVSLVAFDFQDTRIKGRRVPGYVNFTQLNLRTYVRQGDRRGVTYIREHVPSRVIALLARLKFNEPYHTLDIHSHTAGAGGALTVEHRWRHHRADQFIRVTATQTSERPPDASSLDRFTQYRWGFGVNRSGEVIPYRVEHPDWAFRSIRSLDHVIDFAGLYGSDWAFLSEDQPVHAALAVGSAVQLFPPGR